MNKRLISILLVLVMVITLLPMSVLAASNANTVKASEVANAEESSTTVSADDDVQIIGDKNAEYTLTIVNDCPNGDDVGKAEYKISVNGEDLDPLYLKPQESAYLKLDNGDQYSVEYIGANKERYISAIQRTVFKPENNDAPLSYTKGKWSHIYGEDIATGTQDKFYDSNHVEVTDLSDFVNWIDVGSNKYWRNYWKFDVSHPATGWNTIPIVGTKIPSKWKALFEGVTGTGKNYSSSEYTNALQPKNSEVEESIQKEYKEEFGNEFQDKESHSFTLELTTYEIYQVVTKETQTVRYEVADGDATLTFTNRVDPIYGQVSTAVVAPAITEQLDILGENTNLLDRLFDLANIQDEAPDVTIKLIESEDNSDYDAREYVLACTQKGVEFGIPGISDLIDTIVERDRTIHGIHLYSSEDPGILAGKYRVVVSIDAQEMELRDNYYRDFEISIKAGDNNIGEPLNEKISKYLPIYALFLKNTKPEFSFTKVDIADNPLPGAKFDMINRDETEKIIKYIVNIGKENYETIMQNTQDEAFSWEEVIRLHTELISNNEGQLSLNSAAVTELIKTYLLLLNGVTLATEGFEDLRIPALLQSTSDDKGLVTWSEDSNATLSIIRTSIKSLIDNLGKVFFEDNAPWILSLFDYILESDGAVFTERLIYNALATDITKIDAIKNALSIIPEEIRPFIAHPLLTKRLPTGNYILFERNAPTGHLRNPMFYTIHVTWDEEGWVYAECADAGVLLPYVAEEYYTYLRNYSLAEQADKQIQKILQPFVKEENQDKIATVYSDIVNDKVDVTASMIKFASEILYRDLGGYRYYNSADALASDMMNYLYSRGRTTQNLMVYAHKVMNRSKSVVTGEISPDWYFYNYEASIFKTWQKSLKTIANAFADRLVLQPTQGEYEAVDAQNATAAAEAVTDGKRNVSQFVDLNPNAWYYAAIKWVVNSNIMAGITDTDFRTTTPVTRGMAVTVLYAAADYPSYTQNSPFSDVSKLRYYYNAVGWAAENGIVAGIGDNKFAPDKVLTRAELVTILEKFCDYMGIEIEKTEGQDLTQKIDYLNIPGWAKTAMKWAYSAGVIVGLTEDTIDPLDVVTRAQIAQIIYKVLTYEKPAETPADSQTVDSGSDATDITDASTPEENALPAAG